MLEMFLQSLVMGTVLATCFVVANGLLRRARARRPGSLPAGEPLRVVQPLDVIGH